MQEEERVKAIKDLNDIQYIMFEDCLVAYEKAQMDAFWSGIESLNLLFDLSNKILKETTNS